MRLRMGTFAAAIAVSLAVAVPAAMAGSGAHHKAQKVFVVCKHGCKYGSIHAAVKAVDKGSNSVIKIRPGTYKEGVTLVGHRYDGLSFVGSSGNPRNTILEGNGAKLNGTNEVAQNGIDATNVNNLKIENLWARNFQTNGFFVHSDNGTTNCKGFLMKHDLASFNRSYGLFAKRCIGGRITAVEGLGARRLGDLHRRDASAGATPSGPRSTTTRRTRTCSATRAPTPSTWTSTTPISSTTAPASFPNTLDSEAFQPNANGKIRDNDIFWNNFNYFLPNSPVETVSGGLGQIGDLTINYPTGVGVILFGSDGWMVKDNRIFGNFMWGAGAFSDPFNASAVSEHNRFVDNEMGRNGTDTNQFDFFHDGSGKGTCFSGNSSSTLRRHRGTPATRRASCTRPAPPPTSGPARNSG